MSLWIPTHVALGTRPLLGSSERGKKVLRGVEPRLKECTIPIESETFVLTVILQDPFTDDRGGLAYSNSHTTMTAHSPGQAPPHGRR